MVSGSIPFTWRVSIHSCFWAREEYSYYSWNGWEVRYLNYICMLFILSSRVDIDFQCAFCSFYRCKFDPIRGGEMTQLECQNFLRSSEETLNQALWWLCWIKRKWSGIYLCNYVYIAQCHSGSFANAVVASLLLIPPQYNLM